MQVADNVVGKFVSARVVVTFQIAWMQLDMGIARMCFGIMLELGESCRKLSNERPSTSKRYCFPGILDTLTIFSTS